MNNRSAVIEEICNSKSDIYILGYGNLGKNVFNKMDKLFTDRLKGLLTTKKNSKIATTKPIFLLNDIDIINSIVIIATNEIYYSELSTMVKNKGGKAFFYDKELDEYIIEQLDEIPKVETRLLSVCVGQACNFKCQDCINFAPYAHKENLRYDISMIQHNLDKLVPFFSEIDKLHIQGGEPFIYSDLDKLSKYITQRYGNVVKEIQIATNGNVIPQKEILDILYEEKIKVRISNYKNTPNVEKLKKIFQERNISYHIYNFAGKKVNGRIQAELNMLLHKMRIHIQKY